MTIMPKIQTERLHLNDLTLDDVEDIFEYSKNPNVLRYTSATPPVNPDETEAFVKSLIEGPDGSYSWAIRLGKTSAVIGIIELGQYDGTFASVDYGLSEAYWNQGLMTEAVQAVIDWGFGHLPELQTITSAAMTANPASTRVQEKCGMTVQRTEQQKWAKFSEPVEVAFCTITCEEWSTIKKGS